MKKVKKVVHSIRNAQVNSAVFAIQAESKVEKDALAEFTDELSELFDDFVQVYSSRFPDDVIIMDDIVMYKGSPASLLKEFVEDLDNFYEVLE